MNMISDGRDPVATPIATADAMEMSDRQREGLVGQDMGHRCARDAPFVREVRRDGGRVEEVARIE